MDYLRKDAGWKSLGTLTAPGDNEVSDFKGEVSFLGGGHSQLHPITSRYLFRA